MANYPSLPQSEGTTLAVRSGMRARYASNLTVRLRSYSSAEFYDPTVVHLGLTPSQWATFKSFYDSNRTTTFSYTHTPDGNTYTCVFDDAKPFAFTPVQVGPNAVVYHVTAYLRQAS